MGAIQERRPEWGPYRLEMRTQSFYLGSWHPGTTGDSVPECIDETTFTTPAAEAGELLAALDFAQKWANANAASVYVNAEPGEPWRLKESAPGTLCISGPFALLRIGAAGYERNPRTALTAEIRYADLRPLRDALRPYVPAGSGD
ncbi:hypothetical protein ACIRPQ_29025 [Streptomyces sp. NPDC101213]|uniref:hypothetical protein n=1 Tax=Streptomyces sp. NPDC101213 TaxID=3366130 RepID=UPI003823D573